MTVVYLDRVWALNTAIDYLLLLGTARLSGLPLRRGWLLLWAALGGAYAVAVFLPGMTLLGHPLCRLAIGLIMALGAFRRRWRQAALFFLLAGGLAGVVLALGLAAGSPLGLAQRVYYADVSWSVLLGATCMGYITLHLLFGQGARHGGGELLQITIVIEGRRQTVTALHDTGNTLRDPVSGRAALVLEQGAAVTLWPGEMAAVLDTGGKDGPAVPAGLSGEADAAAVPGRGNVGRAAAGGAKRLHRGGGETVLADAGGSIGTAGQRRRWVSCPVGRRGRKGTSC